MKPSVILLTGLALLLAACSGGAATPSPAGDLTPLPSPGARTVEADAPTRTPSLPPSATPTLTRTPRPTRTPSATPPASSRETARAATPTPPAPGGPSPTPTIRGVEDAPAPFDIDLPEGWNAQFNQVNLVMPDGSKSPFKVAFYSGKTPTHEAVVTVLWDYATLFEETWRDGIALVQVVFDPSCRFNLAGSPPQAETFTLGLHYAKGVRYTVVGCENEPDVAGWLAGFRRAETNYLFYVRIAPLDFAEDDFPFVQAILDTVRFPGE